MAGEIWTDMPGRNDELAKALTSSDPGARCMVRSIAAGWSDTLAAWLNAEIQRGTNHADLLHCLAQTQAQIYGSVVGQLIRPGGYDYATKLYVELVTQDIPNYAQKARAIAENVR